MTLDHAILAMAFAGAGFGTAPTAIHDTVAIQRGIVDDRGAMVVSAGRCTLVIYSGASPRTPPDTRTIGACEDVRHVIMRALGK